MWLNEKATVERDELPLGFYVFIEFRSTDLKKFARCSFVLPSELRDWL